MQLVCHCDAYTDQALAVGQRRLVHHNGSRAEMRALNWCIASAFAGELCRRSATIARAMSELGARRGRSCKDTSEPASLYSRPLPSSRASDGPRSHPSRPAPFKISFLRCRNIGPAQGCIILQPYDMEMGAGHLSLGHVSARGRPGALERGLRAALAPAHRRPLRQQSVSPAALLSVPGLHQALARRLSRAVLGFAAGPRASICLTHDIRFVEDNWESPTLGAWGLGLGSVAERHGSLAVHLLPASGRAWTAAR